MGLPALIELFIHSIEVYGPQAASLFASLDASTALEVVVQLVPGGSALSCSLPPLSARDHIAVHLKRNVKLEVETGKSFLHDLDDRAGDATIQVSLVARKPGAATTFFGAGSLFVGEALRCMLAAAGPEAKNEASSLLRDASVPIVLLSGLTTCCLTMSVKGTLFSEQTRPFVQGTLAQMATVVERHELAEGAPGIDGAKALFTMDGATTPVVEVAPPQPPATAPSFAPHPVVAKDLKSSAVYAPPPLLYIAAEVPVAPGTAVPSATLLPRYEHEQGATHATSQVAQASDSDALDEETAGPDRSSIRLGVPVAAGTDKEEGAAGSSSLKKPKALRDVPLLSVAEVDRLFAALAAAAGGALGLSPSPPPAVTSESASGGTSVLSAPAAALAHKLQELAVETAVTKLLDLVPPAQRAFATEGGTGLLLRGPEPEALTASAAAVAEVMPGAAYLLQVLSYIAEGKAKQVIHVPVPVPAPAPAVAQPQAQAQQVQGQAVRLAPEPLPAPVTVAYPIRPLTSPPIAPTETLSADSHHEEFPLVSGVRMPRSMRIKIQALEEQKRLARQRVAAEEAAMARWQGYGTPAAPNSSGSRGSGSRSSGGRGAGEGSRPGSVLTAASAAATPDLSFAAGHGRSAAAPEGAAAGSHRQLQRRSSGNSVTWAQPEAPLAAPDAAAAAVPAEEDMRASQSSLPSTSVWSVAPPEEQESRIPAPRPASAAVAAYVSPRRSPREGGGSRGSPHTPTSPAATRPRFGTASPGTTSADASVHATPEDSTVSVASAELETPQLLRSRSAAAATNNSVIGGGHGEGNTFMLSPGMSMLAEGSPRGAGRGGVGVTALSTTAASAGLFSVTTDTSGATSVTSPAASARVGNVTAPTVYEYDYSNETFERSGEAAAAAEEEVEGGSPAAGAGGSRGVNDTTLSSIRAPAGLRTVDNTLLTLGSSDASALHASRDGRGARGHAAAAEAEQEASADSISSAEVDYF